MKHSSIRNERGSITVLTIGAVLIGVTFFLVVANIGNIWLKKDLSQDSAEMLAPLILMNQLSYKNLIKLGQPATNTTVFTNTLVADANLVQGFGAPFRITFQFGTTNSTGTTFTPIASSDPDPSTTTFNAVAVQVDTTPTNLGNLFGLTLGATQGRAIAAVDSVALTDCPCLVKCGSMSMFTMMCWMMCTFFSMFTLNLADFLAALNCLMQSMHLMLTTAWTWAWGAAKVIIDISV